MKQTMTDYINSLSEDSLETLLNIITTQYRKFVRFYSLVSKHSEHISNVKYKFEKSSSLDIALIIDDVEKIKLIKKSIKEDIETSKYEGVVDSDEKNIYLSIYLDED